MKISFLIIYKPLNFKTLISVSHKALSHCLFFFFQKFLQFSKDYSFHLVLPSCDMNQLKNDNSKSLILSPTPDIFKFLYFIIFNLFAIMNKKFYQ